MEDFVLQELEKSADAQTKKALLMQKLNDDISTIFRQVACYKFEQSLHTAFREKGYLSKDEIGELFQKNMSEYMGNAVEQPDWARNWWIYWSHIRSFFYVYSYASGLLISKAMQNMVKQNPREIEKVKTFLSAGTSDSPKNIFAKMDIDIANAEFWNLGLNEIEKSLQDAENLI
jgi:oligoendopeptidase F